MSIDNERKNILNIFVINEKHKEAKLSLTRDHEPCFPPRDRRDASPLLIVSIPKVPRTARYGNGTSA